MWEWSYQRATRESLDIEVTGVDASPSGIAIARRAYPNVEFVEALIDRELSLGQFDLVVSSDVIEHMYRPSDLLEAAHALLKPGGQILLGTPYHGYLKNLVLAASGKMDAHFSALHDGGHIKFFSVKTLSQLMKEPRLRRSQFHVLRPSTVALEEHDLPRAKHKA